jgi:uncharacterized membrane protein YhaH (DUF805 family)
MPFVFTPFIASPILMTDAAASFMRPLGPAFPVFMPFVAVFPLILTVMPVSFVFVGMSDGENRKGQQQPGEHSKYRFHDSFLLFFYSSSVY